MNFFCKLTPPRPTFAQDMSPEEGKLMQDHAHYWSEALAKGNVVAFGLVAAAEGAFGMGVVDFPGEAEVTAFTQGDPTILSGRGFAFDVHPMPMGVARA